MAASLSVILACLSMLVSCVSGACPTKCRCDSVQHIVDCSNAGLTEIPWNLPDPTGIKQLILRGNKIKAVVAQVVSYRNLETLDLSDNAMSNIDDNTLDALPALKYLNLQNNRLSKVKTATLAGLTSLVGLDIGNNLIDTLEDGVFGDLSSLEDMNFAGNAIKTIQTNAFIGLTSLISLDLSNNKLSAVPSRAFEHVTRLQKLNIDGNRVTNLPSRTFKAVNQLRELSLESNGLSSISDLAFHDIDTSDLPELRKLSFRNNKLLKVPVSAMSQLKSLEELDLSQNLIEVVDPDSFKNLQKLQLVRMIGLRRLRSVRDYAFSELSDLREIQMHSNPQLTTIEPYAFLSSTHLIRVDFSGNALETIDPKLLSWNNLVYLDLKQNNWRCDCNARWMRAVLSSLSKKSAAPLAEEVKCASPADLTTRRIVNLIPKDFVCDVNSSPQTTPKPQFDANIMIILIVSIIGILVFICVFLMCKYKYRACGINTEDVRYYRQPIHRRLPSVENGISYSEHCKNTLAHHNAVLNGTLPSSVVQNGVLNEISSNGVGVHGPKDCESEHSHPPNSKRRSQRVNFNLNIQEHCFKDEFSPLKPECEAAVA